LKKANEFLVTAACCIQALFNFQSVLQSRKKRGRALVVNRVKRQKLHPFRRSVGSPYVIVIALGNISKVERGNVRLSHSLFDVKPSRFGPFSIIQPYFLIALKKFKGRNFNLWSSTYCRKTHRSS